MQAGLSRCWSPIPHCLKSQVAAQILLTADIFFRSGFGMEKEDLKRQVEMLRIHKDLQRMFVSDAVKE